MRVNCPNCAPFKIESWLQGVVAIRAGALFKRRLLAGAARLDPEDVRGEGAGHLLGLKLNRPAKEVHAELLEVGILAGTSTDPNILRLLPPFILEEQHVDILRDALTHLS